MTLICIYDDCNAILLFTSQKTDKSHLLFARRVILCTGQFQNRPSPHPWANPGAFDFLENFGQIPCYVASLDGQMPHPLELQRGSNPPPSRHVKATVETSSAKFSATTNFLFSLPSLHTLNKGIFHDNFIKRQQQKNPRGIDKSNDRSTRLMC